MGSVIQVISVAVPKEVRRKGGSYKGDFIYTVVLNEPVPIGQIVRLSVTALPNENLFVFHDVAEKRRRVITGGNRYGEFRIKIKTNMPHDEAQIGVGVLGQTPVLSGKLRIL